MRKRKNFMKRLVCMLLVCCICMGTWNVTEVDASLWTSTSGYSDDRYCYNNYLYCAVDNKIYRTNLDGSKPKLIYKAAYKEYGKGTTIGDMWVYDGYIYFIIDGGGGVMMMY